MATHRKKPLQFEKLEKRVYLSATPEATLIAPSEVLCEEDITMAVRFDNTSPTPTDVGYAPYVEVAFDPQYDISSATISYLGQTVTPLATISLDNAGSASGTNNPLTGESLTLEGAGFEDYNVMVIQLPFGSFVPDQPPADLNFSGVKISTNDVAVINNPQPIKLAAGFALGEDPLNNPGSDDPTALTTTNLTGVITPKLYKIDKTTDLSEDETTTGPNYPFTYSVPVDVAAGKTITDFVLTDSIPDGFVVQEVKITNGTVTPSIDSATISGSGITLPYTGPEVGPFASPNNDIVVNLGGFVGAAGEDFKLEIKGYFQDKLADGTTDVVTDDPANDTMPTNGSDPDDTTYTNDIATTATFASTNFPDSDTLDIVAKALIVQKSSTPSTNVKPGDTITHEVTICLSDYFRIGRESIPGDPTPFDFIDTIPDGLDYDSSFHPEISIDQESSPGGPFQNIHAGNLYHTNNTCNNSSDPCTETLTVALGEEVDIQCLVPRLTGDIKNDGTFDNHPAKIIIRYKTKVQDRYGDSDTDNGNVVLKDSFSNSVVVNTQFLDNAGDHYTPPRLLSDGSSSTISLDSAAVTKELFAVNGAIPPNNEVEVTQSAGFKLTITLPHADTRELVLTDFLPLPAFDVDDFTAGTIIPGSAPTPASLTPGTVEVHIPDNHPAIDFSGTIELTFDSNANSFSLDFGDLEILEAQPNDAEQKTIEVYFALNTQDVPMANDLLLTNYTQLSYKNFNDVITTAEAIAPILIKSPDLKISTAIVSTNQDGTINGSTGPSGVTWGAPGTGTSGTNAPFTGTLSTHSGIPAQNITANPISSTLANSDAADEARGVIAIENTGDRDAHEIEFQLDSPTEHANISKVLVSTGDGTPITINSSTFFNVTDGAAITNEADFISALTDEDVIRYVPTLSAEDDAQSGGNNDNILIIAYDFTIQQASAPQATNTATATIEEFGSQPGGIDWTAGNTDPDWSDTTQSTIASPSVSKAITATSETSTSGNDVVIAEIITYQVSVTMPESTHSNPIRLVDNIPTGLQYVSGSARILLTSPGFAGTVNQSGALTDGASLTVTGGASDGADITITFDSITTTGDNNTSTDTFIVEYQAKVLNVATGGNDHNDTLINSARLQFDNPASGSPDFDRSTSPSTTTATIKEPLVTITNTVTVNGSGDTGDAGDPVSYVIVLTADPARPTARDLSFTNQLPPEIDPTTLAITAVHSGSPGNIGPTGTGEVTLSGDTVSLLESAGIDLAPGETITITITGNIDDSSSVESGETFNNTATVNWTSADGPVADERNGSESPAENDYTASATDSITIVSPSIGKALINTSLDGDTSTNVVVGETLTFEITITLNEGITPGVTITDTLADGLEFVDAGGNTTNLSNITYGTGVTSTLNPTTGTLTNSDKTVTINFGNVTLAPATSGVQTATITFRYDVIVKNTADTFEGSTHANSAQISWTGSGGSTNSLLAPVTVTVREPVLTISKAVTINGGNSPGDTKDPLVYTYTITNTGPVDAFDISFSDPLPAEVTPIAITSALITPSNEDITSPGDGRITLSGQNLTIDPLDSDGPVNLAVGETLTITLSAEVTDTNVVTPGETVTNTATIEWTGTPGANSEERTGSGGGENDYTANDSANFSIITPGAPVKSIINTSAENDTSLDVQVGEVITYQLVLTVNDGTTPGVILTDTLNSASTGLKFLNNSITVTPSAGVSYANDPLTTGVLSNSDHTLTIDLGDVTKAGTSGVSTGTITITYKAYIENDDSAVNSGSAFTNDANFDFTGNGTPLESNEITVTVREPQLTVDKTISPLTGQAGTPVTYNIAINNPGPNGKAYDLELADPIPSTISSLSIASAVINPGAIDVLAAGDISLSSQNLIINPADNVDLEPGQTLTISVNGVVDISASPSEVINNVATIKWTSHPGTPEAPATERNGDGPAPDDYTDNDDADFTVDAITAQMLLVTTTEPSTIDQTDPSITTDYAIGERLTFRVITELPQGTTDDLILEQQLPSNFRFVNDSTARIAFLSDGTSIASDKTGISGSGLNVAGSNPAISALPSGSITFTLPDGAVSSTKTGNTDTYNEGDNVFFQLGNITNPDTDPNQEYVVIEFDVIVADTTPLQGENQDISFDVFTSGSGTPDLSSNTVEGRNVFPEVSIVNDFVSTPVEPEVGETFQMTITIDHLGGSLSDAHNTTITDTLPLNQLRILSLDSLTGNVPSGVTLANFGIAGSNSELLQTITDFTLATGEDLTLTYTVEIIDNPANTPGTTLINDAELIYSSTTTPVTNPDELIATKTDNESLSIFAPDLSIAKAVTPTGTITPTQGTLTYVITVSQDNTATNLTTADTITVADTLPLGLTFNSATPTPTTQVGNNLTWDFTNFGPTDTQVITVTANVLNPAPNGAETLTNNATVTVTGGQKEFDTSDNQAQQSNTLNAAPDLTITITDNLISTTPGSPVTYSIVVTNIGDQDSSLVDVVTQFPGSLSSGDSTVALDFISADNGGIFAPGANPGDDGTITWDNLPSLAGGGGTITLTVQAQAKDPVPAGIEDFVHDAAVSQDDNVTSPESNLANNNASDTTQINAAPDYNITITDNRDVVNPSEAITYVINVANISPNQIGNDNTPGQGTQNGANLTVTQCFDNSLVTITSALNNPGAGITNTLIDNTNGKVTWDIASLNLEDFVLLTANAVVNPNAPDNAEIFTNVTVVDDLSSGIDPNPNNNNDNDTTLVEELTFTFDSFNDFSNPDGTDDFSQNSYSVFGTSNTGFQAFSMSSITYTGQALPGSTLNISLTDSSGFNLGTQIVTVDPGSNWVAHFPDGVSGEVDNIDIQQVGSPTTTLQENTNVFDLQTHYLASQNGQFMNVSEPLSADTVFRGLPSNSFKGMQESSNKPIRNTSTDDSFQELESPLALTEN